MNIEECFDTMKNIQHKILLYLEKSDNIEENYQNLVTIFNENKIQEDQCKLKSVFTLISQISNNHSRSSSFFTKIEKILLYFKDDIKKSFSNYELFIIFKKNKRILLFLIENDLLSIDQPIALIMQKEEYESKKYLEYFFTEIKNFLTKEKVEEISKEMPQNFEEKRLNAENDSEVCELIRKDNIDEFITFVEKTNLKLDSTVDQSIFETNWFLMKGYHSSNKKESSPKYSFLNKMKQQPIEQDSSSSNSSNITLIEYAAFFGSHKIIKYLVENNVKLNQSIWIYATHSNNVELIQFLEDNKIKPNNCLQKCFEDSIQCFHNEMTIYFQSNYLLYLTLIPNDIFNKALEFHNYDYVRKDFIDRFSILNACKYDHPDIFKILLTTMNIDVNSKTKISLYICM